MAGLCCGLNMAETETTGSPVEPAGSRSDRRRKMGIHPLSFMPTESTDGGVRRKKRKLDVSVVQKEIHQLTGKFASDGDVSASPSGEASDSPKFGFTSVCGRRKDMEDAVAIHPSLCGRNHNFFGVYDGHGCSHVATKCRDRMHCIVKDEIQSGGSSSWEQTMVRSFSKMDKEAGECSAAGETVSCRCELQTPQCDAVGSTAVVAVVSPEKIVVSNCGDSRAVLCRSGVAIPLSVDHKPDRPDELNRIEEAGGRVIFWDCPRVLGVLAMSRAIGDSYLKPYVIAEPEVTITDRTAEDECLILASDGLWDVVSNETACGVARMCLESRRESSDGACSDASILLTKLALARHSTDNVSVVVVDLRRI